MISAPSKMVPVLSQASRIDSKANMKDDVSFKGLIEGATNSPRNANQECETIPDAIIRKAASRNDTSDANMTIQLEDCATSSSEVPHERTEVLFSGHDGVRVQNTGAQIQFSLIHADNTTSNSTLQRNEGLKTIPLDRVYSAETKGALLDDSVKSLETPNGGKMVDVASLPTISPIARRPTIVDTAENSSRLNNGDRLAELAADSSKTFNWNQWPIEFHVDKSIVLDTHLASQVSETLVSTIMYLAKDSATGELKILRLRLHPAELGQLVVKIQRQGESLTILIQAQTVLGQKKVQAAKEDVLRSLELEGLVGTSISIQTVSERIMDVSRSEDGSDALLTSSDGQKNQRDEDGQKQGQPKYASSSLRQENQSASSASHTDVYI